MPFFGMEHVSCIRITFIELLYLQRRSCCLDCFLDAPLCANSNFYPLTPSTFLLDPRAPPQVPLARRSSRFPNAATMPTIAEDNDMSTSTKAPTMPTRRLVTEDKTDMPQFVQLLRRSLSIADSDVGAADQKKTSPTRPFVPEPVVRIPTPSPRPLFTLVSAPMPNQMNTETDGATMVSNSRPKPSAASASYSQEGPISARDRDGSRNRPCPENATSLAEVLRILENKEKHLKSLKEHINETQSDISTIKNMVQTLLNQGQSVTPTAVANQSPPNAPITTVNDHTSVVNKAVSSSSKKNKGRKKKTKCPAPEIMIIATNNADKGKRKEIDHATVVPIDTEPQRRMTKAERKAAWRAEIKLEQKTTKNSPLGLAPVRLSYN